MVKGCVVFGVLASVFPWTYSSTSASASTSGCGISRSPPDHYFYQSSTGCSTSSGGGGSFFVTAFSLSSSPTTTRSRRRITATTRHRHHDFHQQTKTTRCDRFWDGDRGRVRSSPPLRRRQKHHQSSIREDFDDDDDDDGIRERDELRIKASKLRKEAEELEATLRRNSKTGQDEKGSIGAAATTTPCEYDDMKDSVWTITYRFASEPEPSEKQQQQQDQDEKKRRRVIYSGKVTLRFLADGYTEIISRHEDDEQRQKQRVVDSLHIVKAWGWDIEQSGDNEDENADDGEDGKDREYLLFSVDGRITDAETKRFYFQARQDKDTRGVVSLNGGTVTVKQDLVEAGNTPGFWGFFSPRGILAQFRYVGEFIAKPVSSPPMM